jgi:hypothetical protein
LTVSITSNVVQVNHVVGFVVKQLLYKEITGTVPMIIKQFEEAIGKSL